MMGRKPLPEHERKKYTVNLTEGELEVIQQLRDTGTISGQNVLRSDTNVNKMRSDRNELKKRYVNALDELEEANKQIEILAGIDQANRSEITIPNSKSSENEATAVMVASDWHVEETVDPFTVNCMNEYNTSIAEKRTKKFFVNGLKLINFSRNISKIDRLLLCLGGDFISGYIHEELLESNSMSPTEATNFVVEIIASGIDFLLKESKLKEIIILCAYGNHGRTTQKRRVSTASSNNFEFLMYCFLNKMYRNEPRVKFIAERGYHTIFPVYPNYKIRFHHGDNVRYQGGVGGIYIPINKAIAQWNKVCKVDLDVLGHFHQCVDGGNFVCNGSLIGWNAFAVSIKASYEPPKQAFFLIDKNRGKTIVAPIHVETNIK